MQGKDFLPQRLYRFVQFTSGGHSELVPRLPIPNRTVKRLSADDSVDTHVKVGHCQTSFERPPTEDRRGSLFVRKRSAEEKGGGGGRRKGTTERGRLGGKEDGVLPHCDKRRPIW